MLPKWHILLGLLFSLILYKTTTITLQATTIIFIASFMIDTDHYLYYALRKKDINPLRAIRWFYNLRKKMLTSTKKENDNKEQPTYLLHWWTSITSILLLGIINTNFLYLGIGFTFHLLLDIIEITYYPQLGYHKLFYLKTKKENKNKKSFSF